MSLVVTALSSLESPLLRDDTSRRVVTRDAAFGDFDLD